MRPNPPHIVSRISPSHNNVCGHGRSWLTVLLCFCLLSLALYGLNGIFAAIAEEVVSGVLESVNLNSHTVQIRNSLGQPLILNLTNPHLVENVRPGELVTVVVDEKHTIIKLIATPIPELPSGHIPRQ